MSYQEFIISSALKTFQIKNIPSYKSEYSGFIEELESDGFEPSSIFLEVMKVAMREYEDTMLHSEIWLRCNLISPFLFEIKKSYRSLFLWEGIPLDAKEINESLTGTPDYFVTKRNISPELPYCIIGEAKKDNFEQGWGQCLAAMVAAQSLNKNEGIDIPIYGVVTSGVEWEFGKLLEKNFAIYPKAKLSIQKEKDRVRILSILDVMFSKFEEHVQKGE